MWFYRAGSYNLGKLGSTPAELKKFEPQFYKNISKYQIDVGTSATK